MDLSYQKTGTLLRQNVVFSEDVSPLNNFTTESLQNDASVKSESTSTSDIYSDSFKTENKPDETSVNQLKTDDNGTDNNETQTPEEPPQDPSGNNLIQSADDGFSQIDFDAFDADNSTDDHIETDTKEDDSQICATPLCEPSGPTVQDDSLFNPAEPSAQEEPVFEPIEHIVSEEPVSEQTEPIVREETFFEPVDPVVSEESVFEPTEHTSQKKTFFEPIGQAVPKTKPAASVSEIDPMFGSAPSFDIESIKTSFDAKKTGSKKKPKKGLFNRKK